jgi:polysaccharide export outer membrane protein
MVIGPIPRAGPADSGWRACHGASALVAMALLLALPNGAGAQSPEAPPGAQVDMNAAVAGLADYRLGPADKLRVIVFGEDSLSGEFSVSPAGRIALPLIGEINASGRTVPEIKQEVEARFRNGYIKNPRVSIEVILYRPFYIYGEVNKPGEFPFEPGLTIQGAVSAAQGYTYRANTHRVSIRHAGADKDETIKADSATPIAPGDVIRVGQRYF